jgi:hypothetical protein
VDAANGKPSAWQSRGFLLILRTLRNGKPEIENQFHLAGLVYNPSVRAVNQSLWVGDDDNPRRAWSVEVLLPRPGGGTVADDAGSAA